MLPSPFLSHLAVRKLPPRWGAGLASAAEEAAGRATAKVAKSRMTENLVFMSWVALWELKECRVQVKQCDVDK